jgi:transcriptional antiterminator NusG
VIENQPNPSQLPDDAVDPHAVVPQPPAFGSEPPAEEHRHVEEHRPVEEPAASEPAPPELVAETQAAREAAAGAAEEETAEEETAEEEVAEEIVEEEVEPRGPIEETPVVDEPPKMDWFILKVQSNREDSIRDSLQRRVKVAGLEKYFGEIIVPTEMVSEFKGGKKRVVKRKLYPGYLVAHMEINDETWFLVRETPGIGDFTGSAGKPTPMLPHEVAKIVAKQEEKTDEAPKLKINFNVGDRVKINEGTFENFEGEVDAIDEASGRVTVMINIFGRSTPVELEYWQIESI